MNHRHVRPALLVLVASLFVAFTLSAADTPKLPVKDFKDARAYRVIRVVDGDTVVIERDGKEEKVRLIGVSTPETVHPQKPVEFYGKEASRFTTNLLKGESVYLEYDQDKKDKYGRTLAYLFRSPDGLFVNLEIIRQGYGHAYVKYPFKEEYMTLFRQYEKQAREAKRGLWAEDITPPGKDVVGAKDKEGEKTAAVGDNAVTVSVTDTGTKYHRAGCRYAD